MWQPQAPLVERSAPERIGERAGQSPASGGPTPSGPIAAGAVIMLLLGLAGAVLGLGLLSLSAILGLVVIVVSAPLVGMAIKLLGRPGRDAALTGAVLSGTYGLLFGLVGIASLSHPITQTLLMVAIPFWLATILLAGVLEGIRDTRPVATVCRILARRRWARIGARTTVVVLVIVAVGTLTGHLRWATILGTCSHGRDCIPDGGISLALPAGWHGQSHDGALYAAVATNDSSDELQIFDAATLLDGTLPRDLDEVERAGLTRLESGGFIFFGSPISDRVTLPIGPAVRIRYTQSKCFFFCSNWAVTSYWCFVDGRLIAILHAQGYGEQEPYVPGPSAPPDLQSILGSLELLPTQPA